MQLFPLNSNLQKQLHRLVDYHYCIGEIVRIEGLVDGYCNLSFFLRIRQTGRLHSYIMRRYHLDRTVEQIQFEHSFIHHLRQNISTLVSGVIKCRNGKTWMRDIDPENRLQYYWAIFDFLPGEDKYTWIQNDLSKPELISAAEVLAHLHDAAIGFQPASVNVLNQPFITDLLEKFYLEVVGEIGPFQNRRIQELINSHRSKLSTEIKHSLTVKKPLDTISNIAIHSDYHPGNLKFRHNRVVGVFDFDWSRMGYRVFDLSLALIYFAGRWENKKKGQGGLDLNKFELFLRTYNKALISKTQLSPLSAIEVELLPRLLAAANLFILKWELDEYIVNPSEHQESTIYINHNMNLMNWLNESSVQIKGLIATTCNSQVR